MEYPHIYNISDEIWLIYAYIWIINRGSDWCDAHHRFQATNHSHLGRLHQTQHQRPQNATICLRLGWRQRPWILRLRGKPERQHFTQEPHSTSYVLFRGWQIYTLYLCVFCNQIRHDQYLRHIVWGGVHICYLVVMLFALKLMREMWEFWENMENYLMLGERSVLYVTIISPISGQNPIIHYYPIYFYSRIMSYYYISHKPYYPKKLSRIVYSIHRYSSYRPHIPWYSPAISEVRRKRRTNCAEELAKGPTRLYQGINGICSIGSQELWWESWWFMI